MGEKIVVLPLKRLYRESGETIPYFIFMLFVGSRAVSSIDLDVTLMVCLLRNLPPAVARPVNGFDVLPHSNDLSPGAHIARIKYYKNSIVSHSKDSKLPDNDFNTIWIDMEMV